MKITVGGWPKSGKGTVSAMLVEHYKLKHYDTGQMRRDEAARRGMDLSEFNAWAELHPQEGDQVFDEEQLRIGREEDNFLLEGRLAHHFVPGAIKIYISVESREAAKRYMASNQKGRNEGKAISLDDMVKVLTARVESDKKRYAALYNIDPYDPTQYDIVKDSTKVTPYQVFEYIVSSIDSKYRAK